MEKQFFTAIPPLREHSVNSLDNFIMGWYMEDTSLCDRIIQYHDNCLTKTAGCLGLGDGKYGVNKEWKDSTDSTLNNNPELMSQYGQMLQGCINNYIAKYTWAAKCRFSNQETTNIQHYAPEGGYHAWHAERLTYEFPNCHRHLVYITYLNDVTDAGETEFLYQKLKIKPEKGLTIIWGTDWTFTHRGVASPTQDKYIVTGWLHYSP